MVECMVGVLMCFNLLLRTVELAVCSRYLVVFQETILLITLQYQPLSSNNSAEEVLSNKNNTILV